MQNLRLVSSENIDHDFHDRLMHAKNSHQVWVLVEHFVIHDVPGGDKGENIHLKVLESGRWKVPEEQNLPESINHELLLLLSHTDGEQRSDLTEGGQQVDGVLHRGGTDGVSLPHGSQQLADAVVLSSQEAEHLADQLRVLDVTLLSPAHHRLGDQLLQVGWKGNQVK